LDTAPGDSKQALDRDLSVNMDRLTQIQDAIEQLLTMMTSSISYLTQRTDFKEVDPEVPLTKSRPKDKVDPPKVFEENKKELMVDLVRKAKQIELLINSLPVLEPEETQAARFAQLEEEMQVANLEYKTALERARTLHKEITATLRILTDMQDVAPS